MKSDVIAIDVGRSDSDVFRTFVFWKDGLRNDEEAKKMIDCIDTHMDIDTGTKQSKKYELDVRRYNEQTLNN